MTRDTRSLLILSALLVLAVLVIAALCGLLAEVAHSAEIPKEPDRVTLRWVAPPEPKDSSWVSVRKWMKVTQERMQQFAIDANAQINAANQRPFDGIRVLSNEVQTGRDTITAAAGGNGTKTIYLGKKYSSASAYNVAANFNGACTDCSNALQGGLSPVVTILSDSSFTLTWGVSYCTSGDVVCIDWIAAGE